MRDKPIGIFDSGLGGLTALKEIARLMPNEDIVYFGDTSRVPYGDKKIETLTTYTRQNLSFLVNSGVKIALAACGTISSVVDFKTLNASVPFIGVVNAACSAAIRTTKNKRIGVIGTESTIKSNSYKNRLIKLLPQVYVKQQECPEFVPLIETGHIDMSSKILVNYAEKYLNDFKNSSIDTIILGCTHYPIIKDVIKSIIGTKVNLVEPGKEAAEKIFSFLQEKNLKSSKSKRGKINIFISGSKENFVKTANLFLQLDIGKNVEVVDISKWR